MRPHEIWRYDDWRSGRSITGILPALIVIGIGALFLVSNLNLFDLHDVWRYWPAILIAVGLVKLVDSPASDGRVMGGVLVGAGGLFLANSLGIISLSWANFWPLILIGAGLLMLWSRLAPPPAGAPDIPTGTREGVLNENVIFGGVERKVTTGNFRGGRIVTMFGGVDLDLRQAGMIEGSAVIDINCIFGGAEIKIPRNWIAVSQVTAIFGGLGNNSEEPDAATPGVKRLYLKGSAIFGGVEVKN